MDFETAFRKWATVALLFVLGTYGLWTLLIWLATWNDWSFLDVRHAAPFLLLPALLLVPLSLRAAGRMPAPGPAAPIATGYRPAPFLPATRAWLWISAILLGAALGLTAIHDKGSFTLPWLLYVGAFLTMVLPLARSDATAADAADTAHRGSPLTDLAMYLVCVALLLLAYGFSTNTDADDTHFLGAAVSLLKYPEATIFQFDSMFGESGLPNYIYQLNRGQSWEALAALLSASFGMDLLDVYYWWVPLAFILLLPLPLYLLLQRYYPRFAWPGVLFALLFLLTWSTFNHHGGQFFIPRYFQGKSVFVALMVPAIFLAARELVRTRALSWLAFLALLLIAGGGMTSSALYIGIVVAGLAYLAGTPLQRGPLVAGALLILLASLPNLAMLGDVYLHLKSASGAMAEVTADAQALPEPPREVKNASMYGQFGGGKTLAAILLLGWLALAYARLSPDSQRTREVTRLMLVLALLAFNRPLSEALGILTGIGNVDWRWHWSLPIGLMLGLVAAGAAHFAAVPSSRIAMPGRVRLGAGLLPLAALLGLLAINASHLATKYSTDLRMQKLHPVQQMILEQLQVRDLDGRNVLADERVSQLLPRFVNGARVVSPGTLYWDMPYFDHDETWSRYRLETIINARDPLSDEDLAYLAQQVRERAIDLAVFDATRATADALSAVFDSQGLRCERLTVWSICSIPR